MEIEKEELTNYFVSQGRRKFWTRREAARFTGGSNNIVLGLRDTTV